MQIKTTARWGGWGCLNTRTYTSFSVVSCGEEVYLREQYAASEAVDYHVRSSEWGWSIEARGMHAIPSYLKVNGGSALLTNMQHHARLVTVRPLKARSHALPMLLLKQWKNASWPGNLNTHTHTHTHKENKDNRIKTRVNKSEYWSMWTGGLNLIPSRFNRFLHNYYTQRLTVTRATFHCTPRAPTQLMKWSWFAFETEGLLFPP